MIYIGSSKDRKGSGTSEGVGKRPTLRSREVCQVFPIPGDCVSNYKLSGFCGRNFESYFITSAKKKKKPTLPEFRIGFERFGVARPLNLDTSRSRLDFRITEKRGFVYGRIRKNKEGCLTIFYGLMLIFIKIRSISYFGMKYPSLTLK